MSYEPDRQLVLTATAMLLFFKAIRTASRACGCSTVDLGRLRVTSDACRSRRRSSSRRSCAGAGSANAYAYGARIGEVKLQNWRDGC